MGANMMYSPLESVFQSTMEREGVTCTTYTGGTEFKCFFRIKNDGENQKETTTIYYDVTAPVRPGTLVMYGYGVFLALNRETVENDVYYKSTLVKCNGLYNENSGIVSNIPFYSENMKSSVSIGNNIISNLNGNVELLTEDNRISKNIEINQSFNEFGRTFKVSNLYTVDGILHIIAEVDSDVMPTYNYSLIIEGIPTESMKLNDTVKLSATAYINDSITTGTTIDWTSSDNSIATVDGTGIVSCISEGEVIIKATWIEHNVSQKANIIISNSSVVPMYTCSISGGTTLRCGRNKSWTVAFTDDMGTDVTDTIAFEWKVISEFTVDQTVANNKISLKVTDENNIGELFILQVLVDGVENASTEITVVEGF